MESKAYYVVNKYSDLKKTYENTLKNTIKYRSRLFTGSLISNVLVFLIVGLLYFGFIFGIFLTIVVVPNENFGSVVILVMLLFLIFSIIGAYILFKLIPLQLFPTVLIMEPERGFTEGMRRSFRILQGWKNKLKFIASQAILAYIVSFVAQIIFGALIFGVLIGLFFVVILLNLNTVAFVMVFIIGGVISVVIYIIGLIEGQSIVLGTFHGQSYINLVKPELMDEQANASKYQHPNPPGIYYCVNCGQTLSSEQNFCPVCGEPVKSK